ncbi:Glycosyltransferase, GT2 family [Rhizobiales bacterium GAS188]|nr:Glycosyltransferase, GT2 family [Rhizobiales bacterium GAS188]
MLMAEPARLQELYRDLRMQGLRATTVRIAHNLLQTADRAYGQWVALYDTIGVEEAGEIRKFVAALPALPKFSIVVPVYETGETELVEMIASVKAQIYEEWELCIADDASTQPHVRAILEAEARAEPRIKLTFRPENGNISAASNSALELASGEFVALLDHDDILAPHALAIMADAVNRHPAADIFYSDEDKLDAEGRRHGAYFKPDWSPELLYGQNFISHLGVYRTSLMRQIGGFRLGFEGSQDYDLALRATAASKGPIVHVPHVLYHWRLYIGAGTFSSTQLTRALDAARRAIKEQLATQGVEADVGDAGYRFHRVIRKAPASWPRVSAIVPTRDQAKILSACMDGLLDKTEYPDLEIIIADNDSEDALSLQLFERLTGRGVRIIKTPGPFNYSRINNEAVRHASGDIILFLNNDISVIEPGWLKEMVSFAMQPQIGAVGAKLLYPNGTLQHGGVALGLGAHRVAGHIHLGAPRGARGYAGRLLLAQDLSCVTAACMAVPRAVFAQVGGFDETNLAVAFNDVDLCLRIGEAGYRVIWTPHAQLHHHESKSRGQDLAGEKLQGFQREVAYMRERWGAKLDHDPFWNPNLSLQTGDPQISSPPRISRPWRAGPNRGG